MGPCLPCHTWGCSRGSPDEGLARPTRTTPFTRGLESAFLSACPCVQRSRQPESERHCTLSPFGSLRLRGPEDGPKAAHPVEGGVTAQRGRIARAHSREASPPPLPAPPPSWDVQPHISPNRVGMVRCEAAGLLLPGEQRWREPRQRWFGECAPDQEALEALRASLPSFRTAP